MTRLEQAMNAANERKMAATGATSTNDPAQIIHGTDLSDRAVFSGFDIGFNELVGTSSAVGEFYTQSAHALGLRPLFISCWCDGLLTGLMLASLPPTSEPDETDSIGFGGEEDDELH